MRKYQYYNTNDDDDRDGFGANWMAQTFTPVADHVIGKVKLKLFRVGDAGEITISIKATVAGKPVGGNLCSGVIQATDLTDNTDGEWYEIAFGDGFDLDIGAQYAIVVKAPDGDASNKVSWRADITAPTFTGGTFVSSSDSGVDWSTVSGVDCMFEEWGVGPTSPTTIVWGNLSKSQISAETIEQAIARLIQAHENDPDAHVEEGESLNSHKASAIIDHVASSIVSDKIKEWEIFKIGGSFDRNDFHWFTIFESLDGFGKTEIDGGTVTVNGNYVEASTGATEYAQAGLGKALNIMNTFSWDVNRRFRSRVVLTSITEVAAEWVMGGDDKFIGFLWQDNVDIIGVEDTLFAITQNGGAPTKVALDVNMQAGSPDDYEVVYTAGVDAKFYVNGVLKATITTTLPTGTISDNKQPLHTWIQNYETVDKKMRFSYWDFWQDAFDPFA